MSLSKLTPAPWTTDEECGDETVLGPDGLLVADAAVIVPGKQRDCEANAKFIAMARNAFDGDPEALAWWEANRKKPPSPSQT